MPRQAITASRSVNIGPYSPGIDSNGLIFLSGQTPVDADTGTLVKGGIAEQTERCFINLFAVLTAAGLAPDDVQKVNVFLADMNDFSEMNSAYERQFTPPFPARTTIGVAALPLGAKVEIEMIARREQRGAKI